MRAWPAVPRPRWPPSCSRALSTRSPKRVAVRCGSAGHVTIDLFNTPETSPESALLIHLPPVPSADGPPARLPEFLKRLPVASINYRWRAASLAVGNGGTSVPLCWPTPIHDTAFAFAWLVDNLAPPKNARRDIYVYGSLLGAGLATSLSLTESRVHASFGIRGVMAYNGIYNWTMFLPDHRINRRLRRAGMSAIAPQPSHLQRLQDEMPCLFAEPPNLFDPFASPSLFFHSPGLLLPQSFSTSMEDDAAMSDATTTGEGHAAAAAAQKVPRKSLLIFPPRKSTLKIPETLFMYDSPPALKTKTGRTRKRAKVPGRHTFQAQAEELAELMRRSISVIEKERSSWDEDLHDVEDEAHRRVQAVDVGPETASVQLSDAGQEVAQSWLRDRM